MTAKEKVKAKYGNGDSFYGHVDGDGLRHGEGGYRFAKMRGRYEGEWFRDQMHGPGSFFFEDGDVYCGMWLQDKRHGRGCSAHWHPHEGFFVYDGDFRLDQREGVAVSKIHAPASVETNIGIFKDDEFYHGLRVVTPHAAPAQVFSVVEGVRTLCADASDVGLSLLPERRRQVLLQAFQEALRPMSPIGRENVRDAIDLGTFPLSNRVTLSKKVDVVADPGSLVADIAALSKIRHKSLVTVFGCTLDLEVVSALPPPNSLTLFEAIRSAAYRVEILDVGSGVCSALSFLHGKNIVFGALCSLNVLLVPTHTNTTLTTPIDSSTCTTRVMLTRTGNRWWHFGWHAACEQREQHVSRVPLTLEQVVDTYATKCPVNWMPPEILQGRSMPQYDTDVYSFGLLIWEILAKKIPFEEFSLAQLVGYVGFGGGASRLQPSVADVFRPLPVELRAKASECLSGQPSARPSITALQPLFQHKAILTESAAWMKSMGDAFSERTEKVAKKFLAPSLQKGLSDMAQQSSRKNTASVEEESDAVFVTIDTTTGKQGKWVAVDHDLIVQYRDDVEKWQKFMSFRIR